MSTMAQPPAQPRESGALPPPGSEYSFILLEIALSKMLTNLPLIWWSNRDHLKNKIMILEKEKASVKI